jgi:soluble lytic murein transglycosylase-like protein
VRIFAPAIAAALLVSAASPAFAQNTREYFTAHAMQYEAPQQLDRETREYYRDVFSAIDRGDWSKADDLLSQRDGPLHTVARAELYLAAGSPKVSLEQIQAWMKDGRRLPMASQMARLALARGADEMPDLPQEAVFTNRGSLPRRVRPRTIDDGTMPEEIREQILQRIVNDDPDGARQLLDGIDANLSPQARAEWRQRVAWSYYIENKDSQALAMAQTVDAGDGPWVAEGDWTAALAAWRLGDCGLAESYFERSAHGAANPELRSAAYYWASRSALRCRHPEKSAELLRGAAHDDETMYGMLASEQLGKALPDRVDAADFSKADWRSLKDNENVRTAIALAEIGRDVLASEVLIHEAKIGKPKEFGALTRLARDLGLPQTQLYFAYNAPAGAEPDPASRFPTPKWMPTTGWQVDPALAFAHTLQESNFRSNAVSPAQAKGLMQITPITVREHAPRLGMSASQVDIFDPATNLAFGQRNLEMLKDAPATHGYLPQVMAAYNAGLTPVTRWNTEVNDEDDPLLYMESIPYWETRSYVAIVMRNYWMYERQAKAKSASRIALAENDWPAFPGEGASDDGRVYLSASSEN